MRILKFLIQATAIFFANAAPSFAKPVVAGWDISQGDDLCAMSSDFKSPGDTELYVSLSPNGDVGVAVFNDNWSIKPKDIVPLLFIVNHKYYNGNVTGVVGDGGKPGFVTSFKSDFIDNVVKGDRLGIFKEADMLANLGLSGSAAAMVEVKRCVANLEAKKQAAERTALRAKDHYGYLAKDPFAPEPEHLNGPRPIQPIESYFSAADYPAAAQVASQQGTVRFRLSIAADGSITDCTITHTSTFQVLDDATCAIVRERVKFTPGKDASGKPVSDTFEKTITWSLAE